MPNSRKIADLQERVAALEREAQERRDRESALDAENLSQAVVDIIRKNARESVPTLFM